MNNTNAIIVALGLFIFFAVLLIDCVHDDLQHINNTLQEIERRM
jgi:hypothetical protein